MTAHAMTGDREKSLASGMNDHVTKPIDVKELYTSLARWIEPRAAVDHGETPAAAGPADETSVFPQLPGFNVNAGLTRVAGNKKLYRRLLDRFLADYRGVGSEIAEAIHTGETDTAQRLVHTVKGVAGNLSAERLHAAADALNAALKRDDGEDIEALVADFDHALAEVLNSIESLPPAPGETVPVATVAGTTDPKLLLAILDRLLPQVKARKPKQCGIILEEIMTLSWPDEVVDRLREMSGLIKKYKFKEAEAELMAVRKHIGDKGE
jgi:HPt (histidine-containing phosphotransfer) domain-containing protein